MANYSQRLLGSSKNKNLGFSNSFSRNLTASLILTVILIAGVSIPVLDLVIDSWMPGDQIPHDELLAIIVITLAGCVTLMFSTGFFLRRQLHAPLDHLAQIIQAFTSGNYAIDIPDAHYAEFQPLTRLLGDMGKKINTQMLELEKTNRKYREIFERATEGIFQIDAQGKLISANPALAHILGYTSPAELLAYSGEIAQQFLAQPLRRQEYVDQIASGQATNGFETQVRRQDGTMIWIKVRAYHVTDEKNQRLYTEGTIIDITDRKQIEDELSAARQHLEELVEQRTAELARINARLEQEINDRAVAQTALREMNDKLEVLFDLMPVGVSVLDGNRKIVKQNAALGKILRIPKQDLARGDYHNRQYLRGDGTPLPLNEFASVRVMNGEPAALNVETGIIDENGNLIWTNVSASQIPFADWKTIIVTIDTTQHKLAEQALRQSEHRFALLFDQAAFAASFSSYPEGILLNVNQAWVKIFGYSKDQAIGKTTAELKINLESIRAQNIALLKQENSLREIEMALQTQSGERRIFLVNLDIVEMEGKKYVLNTAQEITQRRRAEQALQSAYDELDQRVKASTADLVRANAQLTAEIIERKRAQTSEHQLSLSLEQRVTDRTRELSALYGVSSVASHAENIQSLLDHSLSLTVSAMQSTGGAIFTLESDPEHPAALLRVAAKEGKPLYHLPGNSMPLAENGIAHSVIRNHETILIPNLLTDPRASDAMRQAGAMTLLLAPLKAEDKMLGLIGMMREAESAFSVEEVALLTSIADQIGISLHRHQLRELAQQNILLQERHRLARDLHDSVTQSLYGLVTLTEATQGHLETQNIGGAQKTLERVGQTARQALKEMRLFIHQLRPDVLEQEGLVGALQLRLAAVEGRADVRTRILADESIHLPHHIEEALYQIAQEALNNTLRHACATSVLLQLNYQDDQVILEIQDDGCGFEPSEVQAGGMGLPNMREVAEEIGGTLDILSEPFGGTQIKVTVKL